MWYFVTLSLAFVIYKTQIYLVVFAAGDSENDHMLEAGRHNVHFLLLDITERCKHH